jgi:hypothetical protein
MLVGLNIVICSPTVCPLLAVAGEVRSKVGVGVAAPVTVNDAEELVEPAS